MAPISATTLTSSITGAALFHKRVPIYSPLVLGLPAIARKQRVNCSMEENPSSSPVFGTSLMAAMTAATVSSPAFALVDERMSTEGTGLPFGLSNNLLAWILLGVFTLIWVFYTIYTSSLDEDDDSGLSL